MKSGIEYARQASSQAMKRWLVYKQIFWIIADKLYLV